MRPPRLRRRAAAEVAAEEKAVKDVFELLGVKSSKFKLLSEVDWPDRIFWLPEAPFFVEFKRTDTEPSRAQLHKHAWMRRLGYDVEVHDDAGAAFDAVALRLKKRWPRKSVAQIAEAMRKLQASV